MTAYPDPVPPHIARYGFTSAVRCDTCHVYYCPQHTPRTGRWLWECDNCAIRAGKGILMDGLRRRLMARGAA